MITYTYTLYTIQNHSDMYIGAPQTWIPLVKDSPLGFHSGPLLSGRDNCEAFRKGCTSLLHRCRLGMRKEIAEIYEDIERFEHFTLFHGTQKDNSMAQFRGKSYSTKL